MRLGTYGPVPIAWWGGVVLIITSVCLVLYIAHYQYNESNRPPIHTPSATSTPVDPAPAMASSTGTSSTPNSALERENLYQRALETRIADPEQRTTVVFPGGVSVQAARSDTQAQRSQGLSNTDYLPTGTGMLFVFAQPGRHGFWMKDMRYPIDIIWFDANWQVVHIKEDFAPGLLTPETNEIPAQYVLEVPAGFVATHGIAVGTTASVRGSLQM